MTYQGQCLCEEIQYKVDGPLRDIINCHCTRCRRSTGHFMTATNRRSVMTFRSKATTLKWYKPTVEGTEYGFCSETVRFDPVLADNPVSDGTCRSPPGTLTPPTGLKTTTAIYLDYRSDYHHLRQVVGQPRRGSVLVRGDRPRLQGARRSKRFPQ